ncbi:methyltransferase domain-containing protein [Allosaccharopolyspora coralli]|uniref:Methyltransferase domain-containing protein n=1 Tax=Allosaccharopolyspora coralli TaxID=2665642 RepID=A0A5Q3Q3R8_9PSEU|nr:cyclopropane-fatty-acyl-phospholipid synthase family protein [Allosaccharopolyspora coralli]QGK69082.1 methyltransferase domain-containing protein [Allosaccharopolyspora coralli]
MTAAPTHLAPADSQATPPWDALGAAPNSPLRAYIARRLFRHAVRHLPVRITLPGGVTLGAGGPDAPLMDILRPSAFFHRLGADAKIGFGESYMAGDWNSPRLADLLTPFAERMATLVPTPLQAFRRWVDAPKPGTAQNTAPNARQNISRHYDLSNDVFGTFLDETMTYSSALFRDSAEDLRTAQERKIDQILDLAGVRTGTRVLEIGTGWGGLALRAADRGAQVTSLTLSSEQQQLARERIAAAGHGDRVDVRLEDYRDAEGQYDAVVSVEMIEAVGSEYWPTYFATLDRLTAPGGRVGLQAITMPHDRMLATRRSHTWIHEYIFPGGELPSVESVEHAARDHTTLEITDRHAFGLSYADTLERWRETFVHRWDDVAALEFSERFRRMWEFYLAYSEAGFRSRYLDVWQFGFRKNREHAAH